MVADRTLAWDGLVNGRDLGGLVGAGGAIAFGRVVRSASVHTLSAAGWQELVDYGITTIVDLRSDGEVNKSPIEPGLRPSEVDIAQIPLEPPGYIEEWSARDDRWKLTTPLYFHEFLADHAHRVGSVLHAIASASAGGVLLHCQAGKDRAGLTVMMLLDLLGVDPDVIAADHWISFDRAEPVEVALGKAPSPESPVPIGPSTRPSCATSSTGTRQRPASPIRSPPTTSARRWTVGCAIPTPARSDSSQADPIAALLPVGRPAPPASAGSQPRV